jgi:spermidine synthase
MRIARPFALELDYTREMMVPLLLHGDDWPRSVLQIGLGAASVTKFLHRHRPQAKSPWSRSTRASKPRRGSSSSCPMTRASVIRHGDGADFVIESRQRYDLILVDGFDAQARTGRLDTLPFYLDCRARLADDGLLCVNLLSRRKDFRQEREAAGRSLRRPRHRLSLLRQRQCHRPGRHRRLASAVPQADTAPTFDDLKAAALHLKKTTGLNLLPTLARLAESRHLAGGVLRL